MKDKSYIFLSASVSLSVVVAFVLVIFRNTQDNKFYIVELALPFLLLMGLFFLLVFKLLGEAQANASKPSLAKVFKSATVVVGVFTLVVFILFLVVPGPPADAIATKPPAVEALVGIVKFVFLPIWSGYVLGGLLQWFLIEKFQ